MCAEVLEAVAVDDNFGGPLRTTSQRDLGGGYRPRLSSKSAYMLVYVRRRDSAWSTGRTINVPEHLVQRFTQEDKDAAAREEERRNAHLYCRVRIVTAANARAFGLRIHPKLFERSESRMTGKVRVAMDLFDYDPSSCLTCAKVLKTDTLAATIPQILAAAVSAQGYR